MRFFWIATPLSEARNDVFIIRREERGENLKMRSKRLEERNKKKSLERRATEQPSKALLFS